MRIAISRLALLAAFDGPKLVTEQDGATIKLRNGKIVFALDDGKEEEVDPGEIYTGRSRLAAVNSESATHRRDKDALAEKLKPYEGLDAAKAREALDWFTKVDQKKLIDAGEVDKVTNQIKEQFTGQLDTEKQRADKAEARVRGMILDGAFSRSKWIGDNIAIPVDIFQSTFARYFEVDNDGKITAKDASGNPILTRDPAHIGDPAPFDEALKALVDAYPSKDAIMKGTNNSGSGNEGKGGNKPGSRTMRRADWDKLPPGDKAKAAREYNIVD